MAAWLAILVILLPWVGGMCVWRLGDGRPGLQHPLASAFALVSGVLSLGLLPHISSETVVSIPLGNVFGDFTLVIDAMGCSLAIIALLVGGLAVLFSNDYMKGEGQLGRYYALVLLFIGAMAGLVLSGSLLFMFIFWEITAFCSYALISFHNDDPKAVAGGIKALIMTQFGGIGLLVGALLIYSYTGSYQINDFLQEAPSMSPGMIQLAAFGFLAAAAAKSAQVPFQTWLPDAMEAPTPVSALIHAATMVNAGVYLLARFYPAFAPVSGWKIAVISVGLISAFFSGIMALAANDLKRALAYSTISQLGFMVYGIGCGAIFASQLHLINHAIFKALLFLGAGAIIHAVGTRDMLKMDNLRRDMPITCLVFIIGSLGLVGLPIANGFFSKELILEAGLKGGPVWAYLGMIAVTGLTAAYSLRMVVLVFFRKTREQTSHKVHDAPINMRVSIVILAAGVLSSGFLAGPVSIILSDSLPYHEVHTASTWTWTEMILSEPATWLAMGVIAIGFTAWSARRRLAFLNRAIRPIAEIASNGFGFDWLNRQIICIFQAIAARMQTTQTGRLDWNVFEIVIGLFLILLITALFTVLAGSA